jgi:hypothetical protein
VVRAALARVGGVDPQEEKVYVNRTKEQIKDAPEFDPAKTSDTG